MPQGDHNPGHDRAALPLQAAARHSLSEMLRAETAGRYPHMGEAFLLDDPGDADRVPCRALFSPARFTSVIDRFAASYPGSDRRALVSLWTLFYFSALGIGALLFWLELRRMLPLGAGEVDVLLDPSSGVPRGFLLPDAGRHRPEADIYAAMRAPIRDHLDEIIPQIAAQSGLGRKVLWTNANAYMQWIVREMSRSYGADPALTAEGLALLEEPQWPDGWKNPMVRTIRMETAESGDLLGFRRICCLRYAVPCIGGCGEICPVPEGKAAAANG